MNVSLTLFNRYILLTSISCLIKLKGLDNSGKTTILKRLGNESIDTVMPTQGFNVKSLICSNSLKLNVWDIGGQRSIRPYWRNYYERTDALIYVVDSSDSKRLEETASELSELLKEDKLHGVPLLVFANKQDLINAQEAKQIKSILNLKRIKDSRKWTIIECSSKSGEGIEEGFQWVMSNMRQKLKR